MTMPEGYTVEEMPDPWREQRGTVSGLVSYQSEGRELIYRAKHGCGRLDSGRQGGIRGGGGFLSEAA